MTFPIINFFFISSRTQSMYQFQKKILFSKFVQIQGHYIISGSYISLKYYLIQSNPVFFTPQNLTWGVKDGHPTESATFWVCLVASPQHSACCSVLCIFCEVEAESVGVTHSGSTALGGMHCEDDVLFSLPCIRGPTAQSPDVQLYLSPCQQEGICVIALNVHLLINNFPADFSIQRQPSTKERITLGI